MEEYVVIIYYIKNSKKENVMYRIDYKKIASQNRIPIHSADGSVIIYYETQFSIANANNGKDNLKAERFNRSKVLSLINKIQIWAGSVKKNTMDRNQPARMEEISTLYLLQQTRITFDPDGGNSEEEVKSAFNELGNKDQLEKLDNLAAGLKADPNTTVTITGIATSTPTTIDGTKPDLTKDNNEELAKQRAEAGKSFLINYMKEKYGVDIDPNRINTDTKVVEVDDKTSEEEKKKNQAIIYKINTQ